MDNKLNIICPFCNQQYTGEMKEALYSSDGCDTCGFGSEAYGTIDIICSNCKKLVYRKEID